MADFLSLYGHNIGSTSGGGGTGGGHAIENSSGTTLTQRDTLQFAGLNATDDSTNAKTVVDVFQDAMSLEDFEDAQNLGEGIYPITSDDSTVITADMVDYDGTNTVSDVLDNLIDTDLTTHKISIAGNVPTTSELASAISTVYNERQKAGTVIISFFNTNGWCSSTYWGNVVGAQYGVGIITSYYTSQWYKAKVVSGTGTLTTF